MAVFTEYLIFTFSAWLMARMIINRLGIYYNGRIATDRRAGYPPISKTPKSQRFCEICGVTLASVISGIVWCCFVATRSALPPETSCLQIITENSGVVLVMLFLVASIGWIIREFFGSRKASCPEDTEISIVPIEEELALLDQITAEVVEEWEMRQPYMPV